MKREAILNEFNSEIVTPTVTQKVLDQKIIKYMITETRPFSVVEKPAFKDLVLLGLPKKLSIMTRKTLRGRIDETFMCHRRANSFFRYS